MIPENHPLAIFGVTRYTIYAILLSMRYLGIDFGSKRVGLALSDESATLAFPHSVLKNDKALIFEIGRIMKEQKVTGVVIGESKDFSGKNNSIAKSAEDFKNALEKLTGIETIYEPEFLTSVQAGRRQSRRPEESRGSGLRAQQRKGNEMLDASAAAIILQSYLDRKHTL